MGSGWAHSETLHAVLRQRLPKIDGLEVRTWRSAHVQRGWGPQRGARFHFQRAHGSQSRSEETQRRTAQTQQTTDYPCNGAVTAPHQIWQASCYHSNLEQTSVHVVLKTIQTLLVLSQHLQYTII